MCCYGALLRDIYELCRFVFQSDEFYYSRRQIIHLDLHRTGSMKRRVEVVSVIQQAKGLSGLWYSVTLERNPTNLIYIQEKSMDVETSCSRHDGMSFL